MKLGSWNIDISRVKNVDKKASERSQIIQKLEKRTLIRVRQDINTWRAATDAAERKEFNPNRLEIIRLYNDVVLDAHVASTMQTKVLKCLATNYCLKDDNGDVNEDATDLIQTAWFRDFIKITVETPDFGHTVVQLGDIVDDKFSAVKVVPRQNVIPEIHSVKPEASAGIDQQSLIDYTRPEFKPWVIEIGKRDDLGLLHKATPWAIWKKAVSQNWADYGEVFGIPPRIGKTDIRDPERNKNMNDMLSNMGSLFYAIVDPDDEIEFLEVKNEDAYQVFQEFINTANKEISKLMLGQTMTTEDGSSRSQAEVHERVMDDYIGAIKWFVADTINTKLLPVMRFHSLIPEGLTFSWDETERVTLKERFDFTIDLANAGYKVPADWINETFGVPVEEQQEITDPANISNRSRAVKMISELTNLYKGWQPGQTHRH